MNMKINLLCFILLLFLLAGAVSAYDSDSETLHSIDDNHNLSKNSDNVKIEMANKSISASTSKTLLAASKQKVSLKAVDVKMYYGDGSKFKIVLKDNKKKAMKNIKLKVSVNGKTYSQSTDKNGIVFFNINFNPGKYKILTTYEGSSKFQKQSIQSMITVKSTIKADDFSKFFKNTDSYTASFYDTNGKPLKKTKVKYSISNKVHLVKTDKKGNVKIKLNQNPGKYQIGLGNTKTGEVLYKFFTIKNTIEYVSFTMDKNGNAKYSVKVLNDKGKANPTKKVVFKHNNKAYNVFSDKNGIATLSVKLKPGKHIIITQYNGEKAQYDFTVKDDKPQTQTSNDPVKTTNFTYTTLIPNYVNVTCDYVFSDAAYTLKTGSNGIIKLPKNDFITVELPNATYLFSHSQMSGVDTYEIGHLTYLVPFDNSPIQSSFNEANLKGEGIIISNKDNFTQIKYKSTTKNNTDLFGVYMGKGLQNSETITYIQNNNIKAIVNFFTDSYDELGLKYNLAKYYGKSIYDFDYNGYDFITNNKTDSIKYVNTNESIELSYFGKTISGSPSRENIVTKLEINGAEELEKHEVISYGQSEKYVQSAGFEVLQSYAIVNQKITADIVESWLLKSSSYLSLNKISNLYGMFIAALETVWIADEFACENAKKYNVSWSRDRPTTILGGINLDKSYIHILNADMGMNVKGDEQNQILFRLINSIQLPDIEELCLSEIANQYSDNSTSSAKELLNAFENKNVSVVQMGEIFYILSEDGSNSSIIINSTSGVAELFTVDGEDAYKGSFVNTNCDCCSIVAGASRIVYGAVNYVNKVKSDGQSILNYLNDKGFALGVLSHYTLSSGISIGGGLVAGSTGLAALTFFSVVGTAFGLQTIGITIREHFIDKKDWHWAYDNYPLTRNGPIQFKKTFNIPQSDGTTHYVEVKINDDFTLNRDEAYYISPKGTNKLSKKDTYNYFTEEKWTWMNVPKKYQKFKIPA